MPVTLPDLLKFDSNRQAEEINKLNGPQLLELKEEIIENANISLVCLIEINNWQSLPVQAQRRGILQALDKMKLAIDRQYPTQKERFVAIAEDIKSDRMPTSRLNEVLYENLEETCDTDNMGYDVETPYKTFISFLNFVENRIIEPKIVIERLIETLGEKQFKLYSNVAFIGIYYPPKRNEEIDKLDEEYRIESRNRSIIGIHSLIIAGSLPLVYFDKEKGCVRTLDYFASVTSNPNLVGDLINHAHSMPAGTKNAYRFWMYLSRCKLPENYTSIEVLRLSEVPITIADLASLTDREIDFLFNENARNILNLCIEIDCPNLFALYVKKIGLTKEQLDANHYCDLTPLHYATQCGRRDLVKITSKFFDINARDILKRTPLHYAASIGFVNLVDLLLRNGADVKAVDHEGLTPLHFASELGSVKIIEKLLKHNADVNAINSYGQTPLFVAVCSGRIEGVRFLLENGARVDVRDNSGNTPLHMACREKVALPIVVLLLQHGADVNAENKHWARVITPLQYVFDNSEKNTEVIKCLVNAGAKFERKDIDCATCSQCSDAKDAIKKLEDGWKKYAKDKKDNALLPKKRNLNGILCEECVELREFMEKKLEQQPKIGGWETKIQAQRAGASSSTQQPDITYFS